MLETLLFFFYLTSHFHVIKLIKRKSDEVMNVKVPSEWHDGTWTLTSALVGGELSASHLGALPLEKELLVNNI